MKDSIDPELKKEIAKVGMTATLAVTVFTAPFLRRNRTLRNLHTAAGVALVGFSLWHIQLYRPQRKRIPAKAGDGVGNPMFAFSFLCCQLVSAFGPALM